MDIYKLPSVPSEGHWELKGENGNPYWMKSDLGKTIKILVQISEGVTSANADGMVVGVNSQTNVPTLGLFAGGWIGICKGSITSVGSNFYEIEMYQSGEFDYKSTKCIYGGNAYTLAQLLSGATPEGKEAQYCSMLASTKNPMISFR